VETGDVLGLSGQPAADASVRPAGAADADAVGAVQSRAWRAQYADLVGAPALADLTPQALAAAWHPALASPPSPRHAVLVAAAGSTVVGFVAVAPADDEGADAADGEIVALVVDPLHQRAGHGSRLLSAAAATLRETGSLRVSVWVPVRDAALRDFYLSAGLVVDGARRTLQGADGGRVQEQRLSAVLGDP
jgi:GNAT superfamily N-acetyltransferase